MKVATLLVICVLGGCGGRVDIDGPYPESETGGGGSTTDGSGDASGGNSSSGGSSHSGTGGGFDQGELPPCELGPVYSGMGDCSWLADGRCYAKRPDACACVCPRDRASSCTSGFPGGPGNPTEVTCD